MYYVSCRHFEKLKSLRYGMISLLRVQCSLTTILHNAVKFAAAKVDLINSFFCETDGDPVFWEEIRCANSEGAATTFLEAYTEGNAAPSPNDGCRWPVSKRKAFDRERDAELSRLLSRTEILVADFVEKCRLSHSEGQSLLSIMRHPRFNVSDIHSQKCT